MGLESAEISHRKYTQSRKYTKSPKMTKIAELETGPVKNLNLIMQIFHGINASETQKIPHTLAIVMSGHLD